MGSAATVVSAGTSRKARIASIFQHYYPEVRNKIFVFDQNILQNLNSRVVGALCSSAVLFLSSCWSTDLSSAMGFSLPG